jgi:hypothetical protein
MSFSWGLETLFEHQRRLWQTSDVPAALGITPEEFGEEYVEPLREHLQRFDKTAQWAFGSGQIPFLIVIPERIASLIIQLRMIRLNGKRGGTNLNLGRLFDVRRQRETFPLFCDDRPFLAAGVAIREMKGNEVFSFSLASSRPIAVEVMAAAAFFPDLLRDHYLLLHGSRYQNQNGFETVPALIQDLGTMGPWLVKGNYDQYVFPAETRYLAVTVERRLA